MIERYSLPEMVAVWTPRQKFQRWLDVEIAACKAHVKLGNIPQEDLDIIIEKADFDVDRISEIESEIHHDVIAFLTNVAEHVGPSSRFVHLGLTSTDVVDTAFSLLIWDAAQLILAKIDTLMVSLKRQADQHKHTLMMGRTHGVHAEPTSFGLKLAVWYDELKRNKRRITDAANDCRFGKISGAVGNYAHITPRLEAFVCEELGLTPAPASTQTLQRDRHAFFMAALATLAGTLEKMATEIRALQKTEMNEVQEPFSSQQKGSSAMPHKRNPILCERITGLSRTIRGYALGAFENQALWHERDISHSGAERVIFPDATGLLDYMLHLMTRVIDHMQVKEAQMRENVARSFNIFFSQPLLLRMVEKGMLREDAYRIVQRNALAAFDEKVPFDEKVKQDSDITELLNNGELDDVFNLDRYTSNVDFIYDRVFG